MFILLAGHHCYDGSGHDAWLRLFVNLAQTRLRSLMVPVSSIFAVPHHIYIFSIMETFFGDLHTPTTSLVSPCSKPQSSNRYHKFSRPKTASNQHDSQNLQRIRTTAQPTNSCTRYHSRMGRECTPWRARSKIER